MQYYLIKSLSKIVCFLPYGLILAIGRMLGKIYFHLAKKQVNRAIDQIKDRLRYTDAQAEHLVRNMCKNLGMTLMEVLYIPNLNKNNIRDFVTIENPEIIQKAIDEGKGVVALAAHLDNWEWQGAALSLYGFPLTSMVKPQPNPVHTRLLTEYREMTGIETFQSGTNDIIAAVRAMKKKKLVGFIADQDGNTEGLFVRFFGKMASTPVGPAFFAKKFKAPVLPLFIVRNPDYKGHRMLVLPPFYYEDTGDEKADMLRVTEQCVRVTEEVINQYKDNWIWFMRRWNTPYPEPEQPKDTDLNKI